MHNAWCVCLYKKPAINFPISIVYPQPIPNLHFIILHRLHSLDFLFFIPTKISIIFIWRWYYNVNHIYQSLNWWSFLLFWGPFSIVAPPGSKFLYCQYKILHALFVHHNTDCSPFSNLWSLNPHWLTLDKLYEIHNDNLVVDATVGCCQLSTDTTGEQVSMWT
jgi:hypothetical protein